MSATTASPDQPESSGSPFAYPGFRAFFPARVLSGAAMQVHNIAVGWLIWEITRSPFMLGLVGLATFAPVMLFVLPAGYVADNFDRRMIVLASWATIALGTLSIALYVSAGGRSAGWIFLAVLVIGTARAFSNPASQAILPTLVPQHVFPRAITVNSTAWQVSSVAGPGLGGVLIAIDPVLAFVAASLCFAAAALLMLRIPPRAPTVRKAISIEDLLGGITFIRQNRLILGAISLDLFAVLLGGSIALLPIYASDILNVGAQGLGALRAMPALGAVMTAIVLVYAPPRRRVGLTMLVAIGIFGLGTIVFGLSTHFWLSMAALVVVGMADMVNVVVRQSLVQGLTPDHMRGRVAAVNTVFIGASNEIGEFESGVAAAALGPVPAVVLGGAGTVLVALAWAKLFPELRDRDRLFDPPAAKADA
jgi:MFS family permease